MPQRPYFQRTAAGLELAPDPADAIRIGLVRLLLAPFAFPLAAGLIGALVTGSPKAAVAFATGGLCLALPLSAWGLWQVVTARGRAERAAVIVTREGVRMGDALLSRGAVRNVVVAKPSPMLVWYGVLVVDVAGDRTLVLGGLPERRGRDIAAAADALAAELGVDVTMPSMVREGRRFGLEGNGAAALCYVPVQGIGLIVSLAALVVGRGPEVRFAARQSLTFFVISTGALLAAVAVGAVVVFATGGFGRPNPLGVGVMVILLGMVAFGRLGVFLVAAWLTRRRGYWVIPGLGGIVRRWLPPEIPPI